MFGPKDHETSLQHWLRIAARITGALCLAIIVLFMLGEGVVFEDVQPREWIGFIFFPIGVFVGLVLAWHEELLGGLIAVLSVACFYVVYGWLLSSSLRQGWVFLLFSIPGVLFMLYGLIGVGRRHATAD